MGFISVNKSSIQLTNDFLNNYHLALGAKISKITEILKI